MLIRAEDAVVGTNDDATGIEDSPQDQETDQREEQMRPVHVEPIGDKTCQKLQASLFLDCNVLVWFDGMNKSESCHALGKPPQAG